MTVITACRSKHYRCVSTEWSHTWSLKSTRWMNRRVPLFDMWYYHPDIFIIPPTSQTTRLSSAAHKHRISPQDWRWPRVYSSADKSLTRMHKHLLTETRLASGRGRLRTIWLLNHFCLRLALCSRALHASSRHWLWQPGSASEPVNIRTPCRPLLKRLTDWHVTMRHNGEKKNNHVRNGDHKQ